MTTRSNWSLRHMMDLLIPSAEFMEGFVIRVLWVLHATRLRPTPGLCPPQCSEMHTYRWPCRARIRKPKKSNVGAYHDKKIGRITEIKDEAEGIGFTGFVTLKDIPTGDRRIESEAWHGAKEPTDGPEV